MPDPPSPFRFHDNREKFLLFATTCSEKQATARRVALEFEHLQPRPPALRVFQAGSGEGTLLNRVVRHLHHQRPTVPFLVVIKEPSAAFIRLAVRNLADRFSEHPDLVLVFTNARYATPLTGDKTSPGALDPSRWRAVALAGTGAHGFESQINTALDFVQQTWSGPHGSPPARPGALVLYRADHEYALDAVVPRVGDSPATYDLIIASHPFRSRLPAEIKARGVLAPLAMQLAPHGRMLTIQSTGRDPGMKIINALWPGEQPFPTPRPILVDALRNALGDAASGFDCADSATRDAEFRFHLQLNPEDVETSIGTSTLLAAWNAATYVAQMDEARVTEAISKGKYLDATRKVLEAHRELWFSNECFVVSRLG